MNCPEVNVMSKFLNFNASDLENLSDNLKKTFSVFIPKKNKNNIIEWEQGSCCDDYSGNTLMPIKYYFFPQYEKMFEFKGRGENLKIVDIDKNIKDTVFWGVRNCDLQAIGLLDKVFLSGNFVDPVYEEKRKKTVLIGFDCLESYETCFCESLNYNSEENEIFDILFYKLNEDEYLGLVSERGRRILLEAGIKPKEAKKEQLKRMNIKKEKFKNKFKIKFKLSEKCPDLKPFFEDEYFKDISFKCLSCGICSYVCPTCHCFSIEDNACKNDGHRMRCWDHCQNPNFTLMAGGHNPRQNKASRIRQRFLHKGFYFKENHDLLGCTGCGRCLMKCPVSIDICDGLIHVRGGRKNKK